MTYQLKRVYEAAESKDGFRILVDRLWPRGVSKQKAKIDLWLKDIAPSDRLRKRFHSDMISWAAFQKAYRAELKENKAAVAELKNALKKHRRATLVFAAKDVEHNNAIVLRTLFK